MIREATTRGILYGLYDARRHLSLKLFSLIRRRWEVRISFSSLLRIRVGGNYLLIRNHRRPEQFGPIGGVNKYYNPALLTLESVLFRPQVLADEMNFDLRGFLPCKGLYHLVTWYEKFQNCETPETCLRREVKEELSEVGITTLEVPEALQLVALRQVWEGPHFIASENFYQFRIFNICDLPIGVPTVDEFAGKLRKLATGHKDFLIATDLEIRRGRAEGGQVIGAITEYLFSDYRQRRQEDVLIVPKLPKS